MNLNESIVEDAALILPPATLTQPLPRREVRELGYAVGHRPHLAPNEPAAERESFGEVVQSRFARTLTRPLPWGEEKREAIWRLKPAIPWCRTLAALCDKFVEAGT